MAGRQTESRSLAQGFGGEERLEDVGQNMGGNAVPRVAHDEFHQLTLGKLLASHTSALAKAHFNMQMTTLAHRVTRIDRQVHQHLIEVPRIHQHRARPVRDLRGQLHTNPQQAVEHRRHFLDLLAEIENARVADLLASEGQQLTGNVRGLKRRLPDRTRRLLGSGRQIGEVLEQFGVSKNHRQEVVEVVGHAPRQAADAFKFLTVQETGFQLLARRYVLKGAIGADGLAPLDVHPSDGANVDLAPHGGDHS